MKITPVPFTIQLPRDDAERSPGVHVSEIVRDIGFQMGYLKPEYLNANMDVTRVAMGLAWEDWVFPKQHPEVSYHPGEVMPGGIACSTDGVSWFGTDLRVHECKLTWKSMKREQDLQNEWMWLSQTMGYCFGWGTPYARYHIYWVNGDYKRGEDTGGPQYKLYDLEFTPRELNDNWQMLQNRSKGMRR